MCSTGKTLACRETSWPPRQFRRRSVRTWDTRSLTNISKRSRLETDFQTLAERIRQKYAGQPIDLVMTVGPRPFTFMRQYGEKLFPSVPIVFSEVDLRYYPQQLPPNTTGVSSSFDLSGTVDLILRLQPDTHEIFYIGGATGAELMLRDEAKREFKPYAGRLAFTYLNDLPFTTLLDRIGQLPNHSVVLYTNLFKGRERAKLSYRQRLRIDCGFLQCPCLRHI